MKINEVEQLNEGVGDWMRAAAYNTLGVGGEKGNAAANMYKFTDAFSQQYKQSVNAAKEAGMPMNYNQFIDSYLTKHGWVANKKQKRALMGLVNDPKKLAKGMYAVGMSQNRDPSGYISNPQNGYPQASARGSNAPMGKRELLQQLKQAQAQLKKVQTTPELNSASQGVINTIQGLTGPENLDDLAAITKAAMQTLYAQNKEKYNELYREITTGQKAGTTPEEQIAAKRVEKLKAAAKAADTESMPFSKVGGAQAAQPQAAPRTPEEFAARRAEKQKAAMAAIDNPAQASQPTSADDIAARRIAKQKAAMAALNAPQTSAQTPASTVEPAQRGIPKVPGAAPVRGANGQELPTSPSMNPRQVPGSKFSTPTSKQPRRMPALAENSRSKPNFS